MATELSLLQQAARWLVRVCEPYAALEPRFWTVPPAYHVQELCFCLLFSVAAGTLSAVRSTPPRLPTDRTALETGMGAWLVLWLPINVCNKIVVQGMPALSRPVPGSPGAGHLGSRMLCDPSRPPACAW